MRAVEDDAFAVAGVERHERLTTTQCLGPAEINTSALKGSNDRLSRVDACKDEGQSDASSIKRVTSSLEDDCFGFSMKKGSLSAATRSSI